MRAVHSGKFIGAWAERCRTIIDMHREHVELDASLLAEVRDLVGVAQTTDFVARAIRHELRLGHLSQLLNELETELGPLNDDLQAEANAFWRAG